MSYWKTSKLGSLRILSVHPYLGLHFFQLNRTKNGLHSCVSCDYVLWPALTWSNQCHWVCVRFFCSKHGHSRQTAMKQNRFILQTFDSPFKKKPVRTNPAVQLEERVVFSCHFNQGPTPAWHHCQTHWCQALHRHPKFTLISVWRTCAITDIHLWPLTCSLCWTLIIFWLRICSSACHLLLTDTNSSLQLISGVFHLSFFPLYFTLFKPVTTCSLGVLFCKVQYGN